MSILLGPFERSSSLEKAKDEDVDDLLVFGYGCKLYRDDSKALLEDSGQLLIPWMGDTSLMIDRYDIRNRLEDKSQFGLKPSLPHRMSLEEEALEDELEKERYLALGVDIHEEELREEEEKKRLYDNTNYAAVGFTYEQREGPHPAPPIGPHPLPVAGPTLPEHPPTSSVDIATEEERGRFVPPAGLPIPEGMQVPATSKLHSIIERTALFINRQGPQLEIIIKAKQKFNPFFSFLDFGDSLHPYYRHTLSALATGVYVPGSQSLEEDRGEGSPSVGPRKKALDEAGGEGVKEERAEENGGGEMETTSLEEAKQRTEEKEEKMDEEEKEEKMEGEKGEEEVETEEDSDDDGDNEGYELHPLLRLSTTPRSSKPSTPTPPPPSTIASTTESTTTTDSRTSNLVDSASFYSKRLSVNAAPTIEGESAHGQLQAYGTGYSAGPGYQHSQYPHQQQQQPYGRFIEGGDGSTSYNYPPGSEGSGHSHSGYYGDPSYYDHAYAYQMHSYQHNIQAYYRALSAQHVQSSSSTSTPPPPDLQPIVDKTALYVAKNDDGFERTILEKHAGDPRFKFLNPWDQYHGYYRTKKQEYKDKIAQEEEEKENYLKSKPNLQRLDPSGSVSFKLQTKSPKLMEPSVDLSVAEEEERREGEEEEGGEGMSNGDVEECSLGLEGEPVPKRPRYCTPGEEEEEEEGDKIGSKVQEFLSTVKAMFGTD